MDDARNTKTGSPELQAMQQLAGHWDIPLARVGTMVGVDLAREDRRQRISLNREQARVLGCLREIDVTLLVLGGEDRSWLKRRSRARAFSGRAPLDCIKPGDPGSAFAVHRVLLRRCTKLSASNQELAEPA